MSYEPDNVEQELTVKELLEEILVSLKILILHEQKTTNEIYKEEDV